MDFTEIHKKVSSPTQGNFWLDLNPLTKLVMILCGAVASIFLPGFVFGFVWALLLLIFACSCKKGKQMGAAMLFIFIVFVIIMVTARAFFYSGESPILWSAGRFSVKLYGIYQGLRSSNIILGFSSSLIFFYVTTEPETLMLELEKHKGFSARHLCHYDDLPDDPANGGKFQVHSVCAAGARDRNGRKTVGSCKSVPAHVYAAASLRFHDGRGKNIGVGDPGLQFFRT